MTPSFVRKLVGPLAAAAIAVGLPSGATAGEPPVAGHDRPPAASATPTPAGGTGASVPPGEGVFGGVLMPLPAALTGVVRQSAATGDAEQREVLAYWTPQRMAAAVPLGRMLDGTLARLPLPGPVAGDSSSREPGTEAQSAPHGASRGEPWTAGGKVARTTGRVFLTVNGRDFTCSASVIRADNRDTVLTAGHCLKDGAGAWVKNWTFVPGYDDGERPYGSFVAREMLVPQEWSRDADDSFDFGMAVLHTGSEGGHVADHTGSQPIAFQSAGDRRLYAFGYPSAGSFDGRRLHYCSGTTRPDRSGTTAAGMRCQMTEGSSGGPWFADFNPRTGTGTIMSVISFKYANDAGTQYGPNLGDAARRVYDRARAL
ncbi:trypsin-like serine peptidase [Marinitenerispora sediminis]|uniref:Serine protease n=1 Tax=Marinitenerispora sediminis TaxID=1931232 RepID=A0A368SYJ0_9ACTN|nr:trypsin-like peptidase domain-containing protein [Marinitenerispora sediminis]RCV48105.1 serine protease [Marinitenerispora sediminis]RCV49048.1 serine protease [Marinitenerispora sediminis]RCV49404.1 serine protease [Marinitenerispora sediminis]